MDEAILQKEALRLPPRERALLADVMRPGKSGHAIL